MISGFKWHVVIYLIQLLLRRDHRKTRLQLDRVRTLRFQALLKWLRHSPFYREYAMQGRLEAFPVINKALFMANFDSINVAGIKKEEALQIAIEAEESRDFSKTINDVVVGLSTGTSGNKGLFLVGEKERARWAAAVIHRVVGIGWRPQTIAFFLRANSKLYESVNSKMLRFHFFDLMQNHDVNIQRLVSLNADILVAQPSALLKIAESYKKQQRVPVFKKVISVAEVLEKGDRERLEESFGLRLDEVYQCTEGFLASTCPEGKLHLNEDLLIVEKAYIDASHTRYNPIITDLYRKTQPIVRYKLDDILVEGGPCSCGSQFEVIGKIEGRSDDIIRLADKTGKLVDIFPDYFSRAITMSSDEITDYVLCQTGRDVLQLYINSGSENVRNAVKEGMYKLLVKFDIENVHIVFAGPEMKKQHEKLRRIRNDCDKKLPD
jgi:putative adenylate-forming enzyme